jgi:hypothetical protein
MNKIVCPVCGVTIEDGKAIYSYGKPSDLDFLSARVCQYTKISGKKGCINKEYKPEEDYPNTYLDIDFGKK